MSNKLASALYWIGTIWLYLLGLAVFVGAIGILLFEGVGRLFEIFSPFNIWNYLLILLLALPGWGALLLSRKFYDKTEQKLTEQSE